LFIILVAHIGYADVWFYQDKQGVMHFSQERQSSEWQLLMQTPTQIATPQAFKIPDTPQSTSHSRYDDYILQAAQRYKLDPALVHAVIAIESNYRSDVVSRAGAMGLMQLMPQTAKRFSVADPFEPQSNIEAGTRYLKLLIDEFSTLQLALAAYNAGENAVKRYGSIPPYKETQQYVKKVILQYQRNLKAL
jgi:soluble lytic murein transglycosylase-like protein